MGPGRRRRWRGPSWRGDQRGPRCPGSRRGQPRPQQAILQQGSRQLRRGRWHGGGRFRAGSPGRHSLLQRAQFRGRCRLAGRLRRGGLRLPGRPHLGCLGPGFRRQGDGRRGRWAWGQGGGLSSRRRRRLDRRGRLRLVLRLRRRRPAPQQVRHPHRRLFSRRLGRGSISRGGLHYALGGPGGGGQGIQLCKEGRVLRACGRSHGRRDHGPRWRGRGGRGGGRRQEDSSNCEPGWWGGQKAVPSAAGDGAAGRGGREEGGVWHPAAVAAATAPVAAAPAVAPLLAPVAAGGGRGWGLRWTPVPHPPLLFRGWAGGGRRRGGRRGGHRRWRRGWREWQGWRRDQRWWWRRRRRRPPPPALPPPLILIPTPTPPAREEGGVRDRRGGRQAGRGGEGAPTKRRELARAQGRRRPGARARQATTARTRRGVRMAHRVSWWTLVGGWASRSGGGRRHPPGRACGRNCPTRWSHSRRHPTARRVFGARPVAGRQLQLLFGSPPAAAGAHGRGGRFLDGGFLETNNEEMMRWKKRRKSSHALPGLRA